ncbi:MAG: transport-associated protein [Candidatus Omnitrophica bacterium CG11_big_fil_rev_8_21_14_0_20_45_26]|uniref:Transport-associated protein n=1 Tax=Candidatus Abzuiibacterium crystallinum TaxID=1974748 RepID=A0A2H0LSR1_9BACT|nr:MAG: transport-associated protein [Candidatus Omnitrophica bacterium CG11_big_fil_rev_8_21_14_0_20_45_26]PIW64405.1 MAG: transport-associated protein [Candidatus Omnitrophica bacterium CG12_big_fil_rev_8_21_14_0_65_45_16]
MNSNYPRILIAAAAAVLITSAPVYASETDNRIESAANQSYVFKTYLKDDAVKATSNEGIVTLSGTVNQAAHKALAQDTVSNLPGVKEVDNRLELKSELPAENSNEWIAMKVKTSLLFHGSVSAANTEVYVEEGIVTLRGEALNQAQKELTSEYAKNIEGVKEVRNEMTIAPAVKEPEATMKEKIDDASITAQVKTALFFHRATSVNTQVETKDGIVTLGGKAANAAEKALTSKLVSDIHGVTSVINNMTV